MDELMFYVLSAVIVAIIARGFRDYLDRKEKGND